MRLNGRGLPRARSRPPTSGQGRAAGVGRLRAVTCCRTSSAPWKRKTSGHLPACAAVRPSAIRTRDAVSRLPTSSQRFNPHPLPVEVHAAADICAHWTSCSTRHQGHLPTPAKRKSSGSCSCAMETKSRSRGCRFRSRCVQDKVEAVIRSNSPAGSCSTPMQYAHAADIRQDIRLRHLDTSCALQHAPCFSSIERDIRLRAGHGRAVGSGALKPLILIPCAHG